MKKFRKLIQQLRSDDSGAAVIEYVMVAGMIIVVVISLLAAFGTKVLARWNSVNSANL